MRMLFFFIVQNQNRMLRCGDLLIGTKCRVGAFRIDLLFCLVAEIKNSHFLPHLLNVVADDSKWQAIYHVLHTLHTFHPTACWIRHGFSIAHLHASVNYKTNVKLVLHPCGAESTICIVPL